MFVVPISFGVWLTVVVVGLGILCLVLLPTWLETWANRAWTRRNLKQPKPPLGKSNLERHPGIYGKDHR